MYYQILFLMMRFSAVKQELAYRHISYSLLLLLLYYFLLMPGANDLWLLMCRKAVPHSFTHSLCNRQFGDGNWVHCDDCYRYNIVIVVHCCARRRFTLLRELCPSLNDVHCAKAVQDRTVVCIKD